MRGRILIGALSAHAYSDRRGNCLATWIPAAAQLGMESFFLLGDPSLSHPNQIGRELWLPVPDDYDHLPQKTRAFCQSALNRSGWDYLFKCDDDTAIAVSRLAAYEAHGRDYIGAEWRAGVNYGSGGAGYLLSRRAAEVVAEKLTFRIGAEDLLVGTVLREAGIRLSIERRFVPWGNMDHRPQPGNDLITAHAVGRDVFEAVNREIDRLSIASVGSSSG